MRNWLGVLVFLPLVSLPASGEVFCGDIIAASYFQNGKQLIKLVMIDDLRDPKTQMRLQVKQITLREKDAVYKISKVISQLSIQNTEKLKEDFKNAKFNWYYIVGDEQSPNAYPEDFDVCLDADLKKLDQNGGLFEINEITDIFEDGYSFKDLL